MGLAGEQFAELGAAGDTLMMPLNDAEAGELKEMQRRMVYHQIAYVHALRQHLRGLEPWKELLPLLSEQELNELRHEKNVPLAIQEQMGVLLRECQSAGMGGSVRIGWRWIRLWTI